MKKTALAIRHVAFEDLGVLEPMLAQRGYAVRYMDAGVDVLDVDTLTRPELVVILGGPIGVYDREHYPFLAAEQDAIAARLRQYKPTLGICLGAQLMARALGAQVTPAASAEIGYAPLTLTEEGRQSVLQGLDTVPVLHWHGDQFSIPNGAMRLAETPGYPNQAFSIGPHILGLQFHLEVDARRIERWLIGHAHELATRGIDPCVIRREALAHGPALVRATQGVLAAWLARHG